MHRPGVEPVISRSQTQHPNHYTTELIVDQSFFTSALGKIYVDIRGGLLEKGRQMRMGWSQMAIFASFARYIFGTFTFKATIIILYYVAP